MRNGNWVPISKAFLRHLPKDRPYSEVEAALSLQSDYDAGNSGTINGYSALWSWSRNKVRHFLKRMNVVLVYPDPTLKKHNQKGQIAIQILDRSGEKKGQIRLIDSKGLDDERDRSGEKKGQIMGRSQDTTKDPNPNKDIYTGVIDEKIAKCPYAEIVGLYHDILPELARVRVLSDSRKKALGARWKEKIPNQDGLQSNTLDWWKGYFRYIRGSDFLMGKTRPSGGRERPFKADFEWLIQKGNLINVIEGKYHN